MTRTTLKQIGGRIVRGAVLAGLSLALMTSVADAGQRDKRDRGRHPHPRHFQGPARHPGPGHHRRHAVSRRHVRFDIPSRISVRAARDFRRFQQRDVYYRPHRHLHRVYLFPVFDGRHYVYRPFDYCEGRRFVVDFQRPGLSLNLRF